MFTVQQRHLEAKICKHGWSKSEQSLASHLLPSQWDKALPWGGVGGLIKTGP